MSARLPADAPHGFGGSVIDRTRKLRFRLNGVPVEGFAGDSILSATLAAGIDCAGRHGEFPLALDERSAPLIVPRDRQDAADAALPMDRTPAHDGADYLTLGAHHTPIAASGLLGAMRRRLVGPIRTLGHRFGDTTIQAMPWRSRAAEQTMSADFAIVGGGLAGLAAAAAAAASGSTVVLVERAPLLGGSATFFGAVEDEAAPADNIAALVAEIGASPRVTVLRDSDVFALAGTSLRVHQVERRDGRPKGRVVEIVAQHVILATGAFERLPLFAGNRTPGVVGALAAHERATRFGIWQGRHMLLATPSSPAYRLAQQANDAGIAVERIVDTRIAPHSRFVDFAKAVGITLGSGLIPSYVAPLRRQQHRLEIGFVLGIEHGKRDEQRFETDLLVAAGGWQPAIGLWLSAGGGMRWDDDRHALLPEGPLGAIRIVGAAAGLVSQTGAMTSGRAAVLEALGKPAPAVVDRVIETVFETPDAPTPLAPAREGAAGAAYLDRGITLVTRRVTSRGQDGMSDLARRPVALGIGDVAAAVALGAISPGDAGRVAAERGLAAGEITGSDWRLPAAPPDTAGIPPLPPYLVGRFGARPQLCVLGVGGGRFFAPGSLVFASSDTADPMRARGVVYAPAPGGKSGGLAVLGEVPAGADAVLYVRDGGVSVQVTVLERLKPR